MCQSLSKCFAIRSGLDYFSIRHFFFFPVTCVNHSEHAIFFINVILYSSELLTYNRAMLSAFSLTRCSCSHAKPPHPASILLSCARMSRHDATTPDPLQSPPSPIPLSRCRLSTACPCIFELLCPGHPNNTSSCQSASATGPSSPLLPTRGHVEPPFTPTPPSSSPSIPEPRPRQSRVGRRQPSTIPATLVRHLPSRLHHAMFHNCALRSPQPISAFIHQIAACCPLL